MKEYFVYIATNQRNTVLYADITNNLEKRIYEHKNKLVPGFTSKYNVDKIVWCDIFATPLEAITVEKKIKGWTRSKKIALIEKVNPGWKDLALDISGSFAEPVLSRRDPSLRSG